MLTALVLPGIGAMRESEGYATRELDWPVSAMMNYCKPRPASRMYNR